MGLFGKKNNIQIFLPEKAIVIDTLGEWPVDIEDSFMLYREGKYIYHGVLNRNDGVYHVFYLPGSENA